MNIVGGRMAMQDAGRGVWGAVAGEGRRRAAALVVAADLAGTFLFGAEGARAAIGAGMDLLGILVLAMVTALGGGVLRDVLLGAAPPASLRDRRYLASALVGAGAAMAAGRLFAPTITLLVVDAAGLSLFAVAGAEKALELGHKSLTCMLLGMLTATGGGMAADVLSGRVPAIFRVGFYATAALLGSAALVGLRRAGVRPRAAAVCAGVLCLVLRLCGALLGWHLPRLGPGGAWWG